MRRAAALAALPGALLAACGKRGDPQPPLPRTPQAVAELRVAQRGDRLEVSYVAPRLTTGGVALPMVEVELLHAERAGALEQVAQRVTRRAAPGERVVETVPLPAPGTAVRVAARTRVRGWASALSPLAVLTVEPPPPAPTAVVARLAPQGVVLSWTSPFPPLLSPAPTPAPTPQPTPRPAPGYWVYRRGREPEGAYARPLSAAVLASTTFEDVSVEPGQSWCYVVRSVLSTEPVVESAPSGEACLAVQDVFAPAPPSGVAALLREQTVEVSWSPSPEPDLVRYRVYRAGAEGTPARLAEVAAGETAWSGPAPAAGTWGYTVTAVDRSGNESPRSRPAEVRVPLTLLLGDIISPGTPAGIGPLAGGRG